MAVVALYVIHPEASSAEQQSPASCSELASRVHVDKLLDAVPSLSEFGIERYVVTYQDYRAAECAAGISGPGAVNELKALDNSQFNGWAHAMKRLRSIPPRSVVQKGQRGLYQWMALSEALDAERLARVVPGSTSIFRKLPETLGVEWFAIDQSLILGIPSAAGVVLQQGAVREDLERKEEILKTQGLARQKRDGLTVWSRFADLEVNSDVMIPADLLGHRPFDPFGLLHGYAARIAQQGNLIYGAPDWATLDAITFSLQGELPSLKTEPAVWAATEAITDRQRFRAPLVQALYLKDDYPLERIVIRRLGPYSSQAQRDSYTQQLRDREPPLLPAYELIAVADRQADDLEVVSLALVYDSIESARQATSALPALFASYKPTGYGNEQFSELTAGSLASNTHVSSDTGKAVAVVSVSTVRREAEEGPGGRVYQILIDGLFDATIDPLAVDRP